MRVEIVSPESVRASETLPIRIVLFNDSYEPVAVSRNALLGPNLRGVNPTLPPFPDSVESTFGGAEEPLTLQPFTSYGRERTFEHLTPGEFEVTATYRPDDHADAISATRQLRVENG
jgi:hypothetical protein